MSEDNHSHYRLDPSDRLNGLGQRKKRPKKVKVEVPMGLRGKQEEQVEQVGGVIVESNVSQISMSCLSVILIFPTDFSPPSSSLEDGSC